MSKIFKRKQRLFVIDNRGITTSLTETYLHFQPFDEIVLNFMEVFTRRVPGEGCSFIWRNPKKKSI